LVGIFEKEATIKQSQMIIFTYQNGYGKLKSINCLLNREFSLILFSTIYIQFTILALWVQIFLLETVHVGTRLLKGICLGISDLYILCFNQIKPLYGLLFLYALLPDCSELAVHHVILPFRHRCNVFQYFSLSNILFPSAASL
jgi:hypothetical protein